MGETKPVDQMFARKYVLQMLQTPPLVACLQSTSARLGLEQATKTLIHGENNTSFLQVGPSGYNRFNSRLDFETSLQPAEPFFYGYTKVSK